MMKELVEIREHTGEDYLPLINFEGWRVAILNDASKFRRETMPYLERHNNTDEVFVLLEGNCTLYIGDGTSDFGLITLLSMQRKKVYNIKKGVWHNLTCAPGTSVLIVENADTSPANSDYLPVTANMLPTQ
jgi:mannose-6-phosphate isomerase-like protein (cupin superfamily)